MAVAASSHSRVIDVASESSFGQLIKRIRSRSKSPAAGRKLQVQAMSTVEIEESPLSSEPRRGWTKSSTLPPPRSPSGKRLKQWLLGTSSTNSSPKHQPPNKSPSGGFGSWVHSKLIKSPRSKEDDHPRRGKGARSAQLRNQDKRGALSEEDLVSKSLASEIGSSNNITPADKPLNGIPATLGVAHNAMSSYYSQDSVFDSPSRVPSYVRVSCALSGYSSYRPNTSGPSRGFVPSSSPRNHSQGRSLVERRLDAIEKPSTCTKSDKPIEECQTLSTPVKQLANSFENYSPEVNTTPVSLITNGMDNLRLDDSNVVELAESMNSDRCGMRPIQRPPLPPKPSHVGYVAMTETLASPNEGVMELAPVPEEVSSSADTDTCVTGPLTTTSFEGSFMEEVLRATDNMMTSSSPPPPPESDVLEALIELPETPEHQHGSRNIECSGDFMHVENSVGMKYERLTKSERKRLEDLCTQAENDLSSGVPEDAADILRVAIGKGRLLLRKKFSTFEELVQKNLNPIENDACPALDSDIEGYWHLVLMEIEDVDLCFNNVNQSRRNGWICQNDTTDSQSYHANNKPKNIVNGKSKPKVDNRAREEARSRVKEAKLAAKQRMAAETTTNETEEVQIFIS